MRTHAPTEDPTRDLQVTRKSDRVSSAVHIPNDSHDDSSPQSSHSREILSPYRNSSAFREELNLKLKNRPGHDLPPKVPAVNKSTGSSDSLISNDSSSPTQKSSNSPHSSNHNTRLSVLTTPNTHESVNLTPSSVGASDLISLQHRLAVSRSRNRRPPSKTVDRQLNNTDVEFISFFSPSSTDVLNDSSLIPTPNPHLSLISEEGEHGQQISEKSDTDTLYIDVTNVSDVNNTDGSTHGNLNASQPNSPVVTRDSQRESVQSSHKSDSLKRGSESFIPLDYTADLDQITPTPIKPPRKSLGFERIKLNSFNESDNKTPSSLQCNRLTNNDSQHVRPHSMFIPSGGSSSGGGGVVEIELPQILARLKPVTNNEVDNHHHSDDNKDNENLSPDSSSAADLTPSLVFIPCKSVVAENADNESDDMKKSVNNSPLPNTKKPILLDIQTTGNKYSRSPSPQPITLRKHNENIQLTNDTDKRKFFSNDELFREVERNSRCFDLLLFLFLCIMALQNLANVCVCLCTLGICACIMHYLIVLTDMILPFCD
uniref:Uncharacterized protein n=1 Tax=Trichobilharzia regenti TaxID=157069 RepID=A0AA85IKW7_TRIRE|nr:unnamed protein product [Trichobilharzia regenti]